MANKSTTKPIVSNDEDESEDNLGSPELDSSTKRSLDVAEQASVSVRELNNVILKLKPIVKQAKARTIQKLVRNIQKLKKVKGKPENIEKARTKAEKLLDEIYTIKALSQENIAQYALGNTTSFNHISSQVDKPIEIKAITRVSVFPKIQEYVKAFRDEHSDWEKLGDFILFKQSGRRYKQISNPNCEERIKASEALVKSYIDKKFAGDKKKIKKVENISNHVLKKYSSKMIQEPHQKHPDINKEKVKKRKLFSTIASIDNDEESQPSEDEEKSIKDAPCKKEAKKPPPFNHEQSDEDSEEHAEFWSVVSSANKVGKDSTVLPKKKTLTKDDKKPVMKKEKSKLSANKPDSTSTQIKSTQKSSPKNTNINTNELEKDLKKNKKTSLTEKTAVKCLNMDSESSSDSEFLIKKNKDMVVRKINWDEWTGESDPKPFIFNNSLFTGGKAKHTSDFFEGNEDKCEESKKERDTCPQTTEADAVQAKGYGRALIESTFVKSLGGHNMQRPRTDKYSKEKTKMEIQIKREMNSKKSAKKTDPLKKSNRKNTNRIQNTAPPNTEKVHPSWAASMKRKQEQGMITAFQGKKVKFD